MTDRDFCSVEWISASTSPPRPQTPFKPYLVWARAMRGPITSGVPMIVQWERDAECWNQAALCWGLRHGDHLVVAHWAEPPRPREAGHPPLGLDSRRSMEGEHDA